MEQLREKIFCAGLRLENAHDRHQGAVSTSNDLQLDLRSTASEASDPILRIMGCGQAAIKEQIPCQGLDMFHRRAEGLHAASAGCNVGP